jgi:hypothetical protein
MDANEVTGRRIYIGNKYHLENRTTLPTTHTLVVENNNETII